MKLDFPLQEDAKKTKQQLLDELVALRRRVAVLEAEQRPPSLSNEKLLRQLVSESPTAVAVFDTQMRYLLVSQSWLSSFHLAERTLIGRSHYEVFPNLPEHWKATYQRCLAGALEHCDEDCFVLPDGTVEWLRWQVQPWHQGDGQIGGLVIFSDVITQRKQEQQALQAANQQVINILESITDAFVAFDRDWRYTYVNREAEKLQQTAREDLLGKHVWDEVFPDSRGIVYQELHRAVAEQTSVRLEQFSPQFNRWMEIHAYPSAQGLAVYFRDVSQRKLAEEALQQSEKRLRLALDAGQMGTWEWEIQTHEKHWDAMQYQLFGLEPDTTNLTADTFFERVHPEDLQQVQSTLKSTLQQGGSFALEFRILRPDGSVRWLASQGGVLQDPNGEPKRLIGVNFDITNRKQAEAEREQLLKREQTIRAEAESANRIKDEFLAVLSHELRSPLNPILGWSRLLQTRNLDEAKTKQALETIERNAKVQTQLVEDLLDISRILQGKLNLNICPVDLATIVRAAIETVRLSAEAKAIDLQLIVLEDPARQLAAQTGESQSQSFSGTAACGMVQHSSFQVSGDAARLQQVVWNLLSNAVKFTAPAGKITVRLERVGDQAQLSVNDTGQGIRADFLPHVFDYFRQADGSTTRQFGGLGLGLAIVRHLIELHGGTVKAESRGEEKGATFTVLLPLRNDENPKLHAHFAYCPAFPSQPLRGARILVVDDEVDNLELIRFILEQAGAEVQAVASAPDALQQVQCFRPEVLVADIGMPRVDGCMLLHQIRALSPAQGGKIPAISLTAFAREDDRQRTLAAGFQHHLIKPVDPAELVAVVSRLIQR